jgi:hypothetical protein
VQTLAGRYLPGLLASVVVAIAARSLASQYDAPVMLFALLLGMAMNFLSTDGPCKPGIELAARGVLRLGVALLGTRITLEQIAALGWEPVQAGRRLGRRHDRVVDAGGACHGLQRAVRPALGRRDRHLRRIRGAGAGRRRCRRIRGKDRATLFTVIGRFGAVDRGDDRLSDDRARARAGPDPGRRVSRRHDPRRRPGQSARATACRTKSAIPPRW